MYRTEATTRRLANRAFLATTSSRPTYKVKNALKPLVHSVFLTRKPCCGRPVIGLQAAVSASVFLLSVLLRLSWGPMFLVKQGAGRRYDSLLSGVTHSLNNTWTCTCFQVHVNVIFVVFKRAWSTTLIDNGNEQNLCKIFAEFPFFSFKKYNTNNYSAQNGRVE